MSLGDIEKGAKECRRFTSRRFNFVALWKDRADRARLEVRPSSRSLSRDVRKITEGISPAKGLGLVVKQ